MERPPYEIALMHDHILRLEEEIAELEKCYKNNLKLLDNSDTNTTKLVNKVMKYEQTLKEIKEIAEKEIVCDDCNFQGTDKCDSRLCTSFYLDDFCKSLVQKISECEVIDG